MLQKQARLAVCPDGSGLGAGSRSPRPCTGSQFQQPTGTSFPPHLPRHLPAVEPPARQGEQRRLVRKHLPSLRSSVPPGERGRYHRGGGPERRRAEFRRDGGHGSRGGGVRGGAVREAGGARLPGTAAGLQPRLQVGLAPLSWALSRCGVLLPPPPALGYMASVPFLLIGCLLLLSQGWGGFAPLPVGYVGPAPRCGAAKPAPSEVSLPPTPAPRPQRGFSIPPCVLRLLSRQPTAWTEGCRGRARL